MAGIHCEKDGAVRVLTIDNQATRNAFSADMQDELLARLDEADATPGVRCVVITGAGAKAFSSGHDLTEMRGKAGDALRPEANAGFLRPGTMRKPVIAAVNGHAYAGGFMLAMSCDLRVAARNATFCASGARIGLLPIGGQLGRLPRLMSRATAAEMLLTAEPISAAEAMAAGFLNRLVPEGEALNAALGLARRIAANSPAVVQAIKRGIDAGLTHGVDAATAFEWRMGAILGGLPDAAEGVRAFLEKRPPEFEDR